MSCQRKKGVLHFTTYMTDLVHSIKSASSHWCIWGNFCAKIYQWIIELVMLIICIGIKIKRNIEIYDGIRFVYKGIYSQIDI